MFKKIPIQQIVKWHNCNFTFVSHHLGIIKRTKVVFVAFVTKFFKSEPFLSNKRRVFCNFLFETAQLFLAHLLTASVKHTSFEFFEVSVDAEMLSRGNNINPAFVPINSLQFINDLSDLRMGSSEIKYFWNFCPFTLTHCTKTWKTANQHWKGFSCSCGTLNQSILFVFDGRMNYFNQNILFLIWRVWKICILNPRNRVTSFVQFVFS